MAKTPRNLTAAVVMTAAAMAMPQASMAEDARAAAPVPMSHVRARDPKVAAVVQTAFDHSATFRKLVAIIDASDSYVYVEDGKCSHRVRACFVSVTASETHRYMRVLVDGSKGDVELMGLIAHELRHTIEVIAELGIRSTEAKYLFYERTAMHASGGTHETRAAIKAGDAVRSEVKKWNRDSGRY
jgi:hypothetical protein